MTNHGKKNQELIGKSPCAKNKYQIYLPNDKCLVFDVNIVTFSGSLLFRTEWSKSSLKRRYGTYCDVTLHVQCTLIISFISYE